MSYTHRHQNDLVRSISLEQQQQQQRHQHQQQQLAAQQQQQQYASATTPQQIGRMAAAAAVAAAASSSNNNVTKPTIYAASANFNQQQQQQYSEQQLFDMFNPQQPRFLQTHEQNSLLFGGGDLQVVAAGNGAGSIKSFSLAHRNVSIEQPSTESSSNAAAAAASASSNAAVSSRTCNICGKQFGNSSGLAKHRLTHSEERKYICPLVECGKAFKRQDHLTGHMMTHQEKKPFACPVHGCDKSYCDSRSLKRHVDQHDQAQIPPDFRLMFFDDVVNNNDEQSTESNNKPVVVQQQSNMMQNVNGFLAAAVACTTSTSLQSRIPTTVDSTTTKLTSMPSNSVAAGLAVSETMIKPYKCQVCGRRFRKSAGLNGHMRLHGGFNATTTGGGGGGGAVRRAYSRGGGGGGNNKPPASRLLARRGSRSHGQSPAPQPIMNDMRHNSGGDIILADEDDDDAFISGNSNDADLAAQNLLNSAAIGMRFGGGHVVSMPSINNLPMVTTNNMRLLHPNVFVGSRANVDGMVVQKSVSAGASPLQNADYSPQQHEQQFILVDHHLNDANEGRHVSALQFGGFATTTNCLTSSDLAALAQMSGITPSILLNGVASSSSTTMTTTSNYVAMPIVNLASMAASCSSMQQQQDLLVDGGGGVGEYNLVDYEESISDDGTQHSGAGGVDLAQNHLTNVHHQYLSSPPAAAAALPIIVTTSSYYAENDGGVGQLRSPSYMQPQQQRQFSYEQQAHYENVACEQQQQQQHPSNATNSNSTQVSRHQYLSVMDATLGSSSTYSAYAAQRGNAGSVVDAFHSQQQQQITVQQQRDNNISHQQFLQQQQQQQQQSFLPPFSSLRSPSTSPKTPKSSTVHHFFGGPAAANAISTNIPKQQHADHSSAADHHHHQLFYARQQQHEHVGIPRSCSSSQFHHSSSAVGGGLQQQQQQQRTTPGLLLSPNPISQANHTATGGGGGFGLHAIVDSTAITSTVHASASAPDLMAMAVRSPPVESSTTHAAADKPPPDPAEKTLAGDGGGAKDPSHVFTVPVLQPKRSSRKSRPANLVLADSAASTADSATANVASQQPEWGHSLLRSPRPRDKPAGSSTGGQQPGGVHATAGAVSSGGVNYVPPYTPPPLLSPFRPGSGMFYNLFKKMKLKTHVAESVTQLAAAARGNSELRDAGKLLFSPSVPKFLNTATSNRSGADAGAISNQEPITVQKAGTSPPAIVSPGNNKQTQPSSANNLLSPLLLNAGGSVSQQSSPSSLVTPTMYGGSKYLSVATPTIESRSAAAVLREQLVGGRVAATAAALIREATDNVTAATKTDADVEANVTTMQRPIIVLNEGNSEVVANDDIASSRDEAVLLNQRTNSGSFDSTTTTTTGAGDMLCAEPLETDVMPHINIGEAYQAVVPDEAGVVHGDVVTADAEQEEEDREVLVWHPSTAACVNNAGNGVGGADSKVFKLYLETVSSAIVPFGASNTELALHVLHACKGNTKHALSLMLQPDKLRQFLLSRSCFATTTTTTTAARGGEAPPDDDVAENNRNATNDTHALLQPPRRRSRRLLRNSMNDFAARARGSNSSSSSCAKSAAKNVEEVRRVFNYGEHTEWSSIDVRKFCEAMAQHDKDFFLIAQELKTRTASECVEFYYVWKKACPDEFRRLRTLRRKRELELYGAASIADATAVPRRSTPPSSVEPPPSAVATTTQSEALRSEETPAATDAVVEARTVPISKDYAAYTNSNLYYADELPQSSSIADNSLMLRAANSFLGSASNNNNTQVTPFSVSVVDNRRTDNNLMPFAAGELERNEIAVARSQTTTVSNHHQHRSAVERNQLSSSSHYQQQQQQHQPYYWPHHHQQHHNYGGHNRHPSTSIMSAMHPSSFDFNNPTTIDHEPSPTAHTHTSQLGMSNNVHHLSLRPPQLHHHHQPSSSSMVGVDSFSFDFDDLEFNFDVADTTTATNHQQNVEAEQQQQQYAGGRNSTLVVDHYPSNNNDLVHHHHHRLDARY